MKRILGAAALAAAAALAVPAVAFAHPSVYQSTAKTGAGARRTESARYVVTNHGYSYVLKESNGLTDARARRQEGRRRPTTSPRARGAADSGTKSVRRR